MGFKCAAYGCKSGYSSSKPVKSVTFHAFPADPELRDRWIRANPRKDFTATKFSRICSLHFRESDFYEDRRDTNKSRLKAKSVKPVRRLLRKGAVPSIFTNIPAYLSKSGETPRSTKKAGSASRREAEARRLQELEVSFNASDDITDLSLSDIADKLQSDSTVPRGFIMNVVSDSLFCYLLHIEQDVPKIVASICLKPDMTVVCSLGEKTVPAAQYGDLLTKCHVAKLSQLVNLMARLKSWQDDSSSKPLSLYIQTAVSMLQNAQENSPDPDIEEFRKISVIVEQLRLLLYKKHGRQYSPQLMILAYMLMASSTSAYNVLLQENIFSLPSVATLKRLTRNVAAANVESETYLKLRISKLGEFERTVLLIIDEIYVSKRVEYAGGDVIGMTPDGKAASTLLCFMIKSVAGHYKDIVAIYPVDKLTAAKMHECYVDVMRLLHKTLVSVVAISVDNAATNRKFFCGPPMCREPHNKRH